MGGPMASLAFGKRSVTAWAIIWELECQKTSRPSRSSKVSNFSSVSSFMGSFTFMIEPLTLAASTFFASPFEIFSAISIGVIPALYSLTEPSGNFILTLLI